MNIIYDAIKNTVRYKDEEVDFFCGPDFDTLAQILVELRFGVQTTQNAYIRLLKITKNFDSGHMVAAEKLEEVIRQAYFIGLGDANRYPETIGRGPEAALKKSRVEQISSDIQYQIDNDKLKPFDYEVEKASLSRSFKNWKLPDE